jgi:predicted metal-dependent HD superfamily phosphohydrolase
VIRQTFIQTLGHYSNDKALTEAYWSEIEKAYASNSRHYHNLNHLDFLVHKLAEVQIHLSDWDTVIFSIVYHDVVYHVLKKNNEEKSAALANRRLNEIGYPKEKIDLCIEMILATKRHSLHNNPDINFFTDADLAILGAVEATYQEYVRNVRKEYSIYPDLIYNPGRKNVLNYFLGMEKIFKTETFFLKYEKQARINLKTELLQLK